MKIDHLKIGITALVVATGSLLGSCLDTEDNLSDFIPEDSAFVSIANFSPNAGGLVFFSGEDQVNSNPLNYSSVSNGYFAFDEGSYEFTVTKPNSDHSSSLNINLKKHKLYTLFAVNTLENIELISWEDNYFIPDINKSIARFIQLSPDLPEVIVKFKTQTDDIGTFNFKEGTDFQAYNETFNETVYVIDASTSDTLVSKNINLVSNRAFTIVSKGLVDTEDGNQLLDIFVYSTPL